MGLLSVGDKFWMGGVYYVSNLIRALRCLPAGEQPEIALIFPLFQGPLYADIGKPLKKLAYMDYRGRFLLVPHRTYRIIEPILGTMHSLKILQPLLSLKSRIRRGCKPDGAAAGASQAANGTDNGMDHFLNGVGKEEGISLCFPCLKSMGPGAPVPWLPWIPDFQHRVYPDFFSEAERGSRERNFERIGNDAEIVIVSSRNALEDFRRFFPGNGRKARVIRFRSVPAPDWYTGNIPETRRRFNLPERYLMIANQFYLHKNHRCAFEAVKIMVDRGMDVHLVCTGSTQDHRNPQFFSTLRDLIEALHLESRIHILGLLPRHTQIQLMRGAMAIVQPSLFEGWSTVVEDSRALGKRMFLSDIPVHKEQNPPQAVYFSPHSPEQLAEELCRAWNGLPSGQCREMEEEALKSYNRLITEYARDFMAVADELLHVHAKM